jgi:prophage regulatory protein
MHLVNETRTQVRRDRLLRLPEVETATGLKKSTIYLLMKRGEFVSCVQVTPRCVAWPESRVFQWVQDRIAEADKKGGNAAEPVDTAGDSVPRGANVNKGRPW